MIWTAFNQQYFSHVLQEDTHNRECNVSFKEYMPQRLLSVSPKIGSWYTGQGKSVQKITLIEVILQGKNIYNNVESNVCFKEYMLQRLLSYSPNTGS